MNQENVNKHRYYEVREWNMNKNDQEFIIQKIRTQYTEKENTQLNALKALDAKVKRPANVFAYIFGVVGTLLLGSGMSLVMTDFGAVLGMSEAMGPGIVLGVISLVIVLINYPIYKNILGSRKKKYADEIIRLSDKMMKG